MKYKKTDIIKFVCIGICLVIESLFCLLAVYNVFNLLFAKQADIIDIILLLYSFILFTVSVGSCLRMKRGHRLVLLTSFLMKVLATWFAIFLIGIADSGLDGPAIGILVVGMFLLGIVILACKHVSKGKNTIEPKKEAWKIPVFESDKAKWACDDAAAEYCRLHGKNMANLTDEDNQKIYEYAAAPTAYFLAWLIKYDFVSEQFKSEHDSELLENIKNETASPIEFFGSEMDYVLLREDLSEEKEILPFVDYYYFRDNIIRKIYSHKRKYYIFDYYEAVRDDNRVFYCNEFSWDIYHKLEKLIFESYKFYLISNEECREDEEIIKWNLLDEKLKLEVSEGVSGEYIQKCVSNLNNLSDSLIDALCDKFIDIWQEVSDEVMTNKRDILKQIQPCTMVIYTPQGEEPAFAIRGECDFEQEHGFSFVIRGDFLLTLGYNMDYTSPWIYENELVYEKEKSIRGLNLTDINTIDKAEMAVCNGILKSVYLTPLCFNGEEKESNRVYLPPFVAAIKAKCDIIAECLSALGMADKCCCEAKYKDNSLVPCRLYIKAIEDDKNAYFDVIYIWGEY